MQYTYARCCSVLRKAGEVKAKPDYAALTDDEAMALIKLLALFPEAVRDAALRSEPCVLTRATTEIAKAYNKFYYEHRILTQDAGESAARLALTCAVKEVIGRGLYLIGLEAPEQM